MLCEPTSSLVYVNLIVPSEPVTPVLITLSSSLSDTFALGIVKLFSSSTVTVKTHSDSPITLYTLFAVNIILVLSSVDSGSILTILLNGVVGAIIYFIACKILKIEEFNEAIDMIKSKLFKKEI